MKNAILGVVGAGVVLYLAAFIFNHISPWVGIGFVVVVLLLINKFLKR